MKKKAMRNLVNMITESVEVLHVEVDRPFVITVLGINFDEKQYTFCGAAKVNWPDPWNPSTGRYISKGRAINRFARRIYNELTTEERVQLAHQPLIFYTAHSWYKGQRA